MTAARKPQNRRSPPAAEFVSGELAEIVWLPKVLRKNYRGALAEALGSGQAIWSHNGVPRTPSPEDIADRTLGMVLISKAYTMDSVLDEMRR